ncbi:hypothetical protein BN159_2561 [Streptomyces davaonensis JCM 4913]|uniref:Sugar phosphate isomerase/epimerase n=1 Tax=Streptomyces davaonensis (strain DSM 101723 / JCM 4913 / KCC S-0913 / 768) TaxID=1214101 RepID=K4R1H8_STRDJ|nr:EboA domain-containing protein [Streptomyces davaonensis]CCK26940.1 hypothetical protein BN159_2561 [Streptomyces davaonensis JCM 4913]
MASGLVTPEQLRTRLAGLLSPAALVWVEDACAVVSEQPEAVMTLSAGAGLRCGRAALGPGFEDWTADEAARALMLCALPLNGPELAAAVESVYHLGDSSERRAVLRALPMLGVGERSVGLVRDALGTNDPRLVAAALGPGAATYLDQSSWRDGVLKCLFLEVPLTVVADLYRRTDAELIRMLRHHAAERAAVGETVPADLNAVIDRWEG